MLFIFVNTYVFHHFCIKDSEYLSEFGKYQKKDHLPSPKQLFLTFCTISQVWVISNFQNASFGRNPIRSREEQARPPNWLIKFSILINSRIEGICQVFKLKLNGVITDYIYVGGHILLALPTVNSDQHCVRFGNYFQTRKFQTDVQYDRQQLTTQSTLANGPTAKVKVKSPQYCKMKFWTFPNAKG